MFDDIQENSNSVGLQPQPNNLNPINLQQDPENNETVLPHKENIENTSPAVGGLNNAAQQTVDPTRFIRGGQPLEPEDIFEEIDKDTQRGGDDYINQPPDARLSASFGQTEKEEEMLGLTKKKNSKIKVIIIILVVFLAAILSAWFAYTYFIKSSTVDETNIEQSDNENILPESSNINNNTLNRNTNTNAETNTNTNVNTNTNIPVEPAQPADTDGDGLTDDDEVKLGTDPKKADTDGDGLTDQEEVIKYKTNPRNTDTDGDGFKDGDEVKNGYNPKGEGKLIDKVELP